MLQSVERRAGVETSRCDAVLGVECRRRSARDATLVNGRVYTFGATGLLNAPDAASGAVMWSRNPASDTGTQIPTRGFGISPLVVDDLVIVAVSGTLAAYDLATGTPRWVGPDRDGTYSSPQLATIDGVAQILLLSLPGATSVAPSDGAPL